MRVQLVCVGRPRQAALATAIEEYENRAARYWPFQVAEVKEEAARSIATDVVRRRETDRLAERILPGAQTVVCDVDGRSMTSERFAEWLIAERDRARDVAFVIGGAFGLAPDLGARASLRLSLAPWTLPHELARLVLAEQLYRAGTIARGEPYHK